MVRKVPRTLAVTGVINKVTGTVLAVVVAVAVTAVVGAGHRLPRPAVVAEVAVRASSPARTRSNNRVQVRPPPIPAMLIMRATPDKEVLQPEVTATLDV